MFEKLLQGVALPYCNLQQSAYNHWITVDMIDLIGLNNDQRREKINSDQRFAALKEAQKR